MQITAQITWTRERFTGLREAQSLQSHFYLHGKKKCGGLKNSSKSFDPSTQGSG